MEPQSQSPVKQNVSFITKLFNKATSAAGALTSNVADRNGSGGKPSQLTDEQKTAIRTFKKDTKMQEALLDMGLDATAFFRHSNMAPAYNSLSTTHDENAFLELAQHVKPKRTERPTVPVPTWIDKMLGDSDTPTTKLPTFPITFPVPQPTYQTSSSFATAFPTASKTTATPTSPMATTPTSPSIMTALQMTPTTSPSTIQTPTSGHSPSSSRMELANAVGKDKEETAAQENGAKNGAEERPNSWQKAFRSVVAHLPLPPMPPPPVPPPPVQPPSVQLSTSTASASKPSDHSWYQKLKNMFESKLSLKSPREMPADPHPPSSTLSPASTKPPAAARLPSPKPKPSSSPEAVPSPAAPSSPVASSRHAMASADTGASARSRSPSPSPLSSLQDMLSSRLAEISPATRPAAPRGLPIPPPPPPPPPPGHASRRALSPPSGHASRRVLSPTSREEPLQDQELCATPSACTTSSAPSGPGPRGPPTVVRRRMKALTAEQRKAIKNYKRNKKIQEVLLGIGHDATSFYRYPNLTSAFNKLSKHNVPEFLEIARTCAKRNVDPNNLIPEWIEQLLSHKGNASSRRLSPVPPPRPDRKSVV